MEEPLYNFKPLITATKQSETSVDVTYALSVKLRIRLKNQDINGKDGFVARIVDPGMIFINDSIGGNPILIKSYSIQTNMELPQHMGSVEINLGNPVYTKRKISGSTGALKFKAVVDRVPEVMVLTESGRPFKRLDTTKEDTVTDTFAVEPNAAYTYNLSAIRVDTDSSTVKSEEGRYAFITANISTGFTGTNNKIQSCKLQKFGAQSPISTTWYSSSKKTSAVSFPRPVLSSPETWYTWIPIDELAWSFDFSLTNKFEEQETVRLVVPAIFRTMDFLAGGKGVAIGKRATQEGFDVDMGTVFRNEIKCSEINGNIKNIYDVFYPVGSYYETSLPSAIPSGKSAPTSTDLENLGVTWFNPKYAWGGTWTSEQINDDAIVDTTIYNGTDGIIWGEKWASGRMTIRVYIYSLTITNYSTYNNMYGYEQTIDWATYTGWNFKDTNYSVSYDWKIDSNFAIPASEMNRYTGKCTVYALSSGSGSRSVNISLKADGFWKNYVQPQTLYRWHRTA